MKSGIKNGIYLKFIFRLLPVSVIHLQFLIAPAFSFYILFTFLENLKCRFLKYSKYFGFGAYLGNLFQMFSFKLTKREIVESWQEVFSCYAEIFEASLCLLKYHTMNAA
jgi:hypothetical protein